MVFSVLEYFEVKVEVKVEVVKVVKVEVDF